MVAVIDSHAPIYGVFFMCFFMPVLGLVGVASAKWIHRKVQNCFRRFGTKKESNL